MKCECGGKGYTTIDPKGNHIIKLCVCRRESLILRRLREGKFPKKYHHASISPKSKRPNLQPFVPWGNQENRAHCMAALGEAQAVARRLYSFFKKNTGDPIGCVFMGKPGAGKTFLACGIVNLLLECGIHPVGFFCAETSVAQAIGSGNTYEWVESQKRFKVLVIDDLNPPEDDDKYSRAYQRTAGQVIDARYGEDLPTIITTNTNHEINPVFDDRIYSRMTETCDFFHVQSEDHRQYMQESRV